MCHRDVLKLFISFRLSATFATGAKAYGPIVPLTTAYCDPTGRIGRNRKRGHIRCRKMQFFGAGQGIRRLVASPKSNPARISFTSTWQSIRAFKGERSSVKWKLGRRCLIRFSGAVPRATGKHGSKRNQKGRTKKAHHGSLVDN